MAYISRKLRDLVTTRADDRCEYCQAARSIVAYMEIDHIKPEAKQGRTVENNLCLVCINCNRHKSDFENAVDPETELISRLFHPRKDKWQDHFMWDKNGATLIGLTPIGRATINRLQMNDIEIVIARLRWVTAGWHPPAAGSA